MQLTDEARFLNAAKAAALLLQIAGYIIGVLGLGTACFGLLAAFGAAGAGGLAVAAAGVVATALAAVIINLGSWLLAGSSLFVRLVHDAGNRKGAA